LNHPIATVLSPEVLRARILRGELGTPALSRSNAGNAIPPYRAAMRERESDEAQPRFEEVTTRHA
jgi:hypothetical protein